MEINKRSRTELKQYFVKNAIPTEKNFAELIEGMLNQKEDGIVKLPGDPLSIEAAGDDTSQKKAIQFYSNFTDANPTWVLSLNPRQNPSDAATAKPGLSITDGAGNSRLFIERSTGRIGIGTVGPLQAALHVDRGATNALALMLSSSGPGWGSGLQLKNTPASGVAKTFGIYAGSGALHITDVDASADRMLITNDGAVGIGVVPSNAKLHVAGTVRANRFTSDNTLVLTDYTTVNPASNVYLYSPPRDRDAWLYLDSAATNDNWGIYHRQIDSAVNGLPGNSIGFVGGGQSKLQAYISLGDGSAFFAGNVGMAQSLTISGGLAVHGPINYDGQLNKLDIAENFTATVCCADFKIGGVTGRRSSPGRALVDYTDNTLYVNFGSDWATTKIGSKLIVVGSISGGETSTGWTLGRGAWGPDNWLRITTTPLGNQYHDLAVDSFWAAGTKRYDLAEVTPVRAEDHLEQGDVVVIDREDGMRVSRSTRAYDSAVYGIVSSYHQAAMVIGGFGGPEQVMNATDKLPIALVGRVKVKVSAENGSIRVGDLLTTSSTPGHLMRCEDPGKHPGAIAGKALEPFAGETGTITALVTLQ